MGVQLGRLAVVVGSVRESRFGPVVAAWMADQARRHGEFEVEIVDPVETQLPLALPAAPPAAESFERPAQMEALTRRLESADAFVVVTPEYNHSFPASLKSLIDWHFFQ